MWRINLPKILLAALFLAASLFFTVSPSQAAGAKKVDKVDKADKVENADKADKAEKVDKPKSKPNTSEKMAKSESPINIKADRMEAKQEDRTVIFEGHVVVTQDDLTITGNRMKVVGLPAEKTEKSAAKTPSGQLDAATPTDRIDYIEVEGDVRVTQQDRLATANKGIFYQKEQKIVLHGHPVVTKGQDKVEGNLITVYLEQGRSVVEGGNGAQVQAVLFPGKKE
jgi:lipopolysaccharide export system protein LptA